MKINIVRQDSLKYRKAQTVRRINAAILFGSIGIFALTILYMMTQFIYLGYRQDTLAKSLASLQATYNSRSRDVAEYYMVKKIVAATNDLQAKRFKYKDFLNSLANLLPSRAVLSAVDFGSKGVVVATIRLTSLDDYETLMRNIDGVVSDKGSLFMEVAQKSLSRGKTGSYTVILELIIK